MYKENPSLEDVLKAGTGIRIPKKQCLEIIEEIQAVCGKELDRTENLL